jgi:hypothetical protein
MGRTMTDAERQIADAVRRACLEAAHTAYQNAGMSGLCAEGRWELALQAIRNLDLEEALDERRGS